MVVRVKVFGAGSLDFVGFENPKDLYDSLVNRYDGVEVEIGKGISVYKIKRGPRKKSVVADEGAEAVQSE